MDSLRKTIFCDHAATTPLHPKVLSVMNRIQKDTYGNPNSPYRMGQKARSAVETARRDIAAAVHCRPGEVLFTSGGTESNNLAVKGILQPGQHCITTTVNHASLSQPLKFLEKSGVSVSWLKPDSNGKPSLSDLRNAIRPETRLICFTWGHNEFGTVLDIPSLAVEIKHPDMLIFADAVQTLGKIPVHFDSSGIDLMSISSHKVYGPKGIGALVVRAGTGLKPIIHGGSQEHRLRAGTENVAGIAGFAAAVRMISSEMEKNREHLVRFTSLFLNKMKELEIPHHQNTANELPGLLNIHFPGIPAQEMIIGLDLKGIAVSGGSACTSGSRFHSELLSELGLPEKTVQSSIRISFGRENTDSDIFRLADGIKEIHRRFRGQL